MKFLLEIILIIILISVVSHGVRGSKTKLGFEDDNINLEEQLNRMNKPPISSYKKNGDIIDCIDMYNQPAFDHPLLKNHKLQLRPSSLPKPSSKTKKMHGKKSRGENIEACPEGSVPIKRVQREDLLRQNAFRNQRHPRFGSLAANGGSFANIAGVSTPVDDLSQQYTGAKTTISVYNKTLVPPQVTQAFLWIGSDIDVSYNSIEYGWTINPHLYGDLEPRTYSAWTADGLQHTGCYNALCPGYVQVSKKRIMGEVNKPVSTYGESIYAMEFSIFKDKITGNWWLVEHTGYVQNEFVGYWPKELFSTMKDFGKVVQIGGKAYNPPNIVDKAPMGSGSFVPDDFMKSCYASNIEFVGPDFKYYFPSNVPMQVAADAPDIYKAQYLGDATKIDPARGYAVLFGGPIIRQ